MTKMNDDERSESNHNRRMTLEAKAESRIEKQEEEAREMIGHLNSGKMYVYPVGGRYREGTERELVNFLIRNKYV